MNSGRLIFVLGCLMATLAGCAVGPDFTRPKKPQLSGYTAAKTPETITSTTGEPAQQILVGEEISAQWWDLFRSPTLNDVVRDAIRENKTLAAVRQTLAAARENVTAVRGGLFPDANLSFNASRNKSGAGIGNLYALSPNVSYAPDVFGGTRRQIEQQQAFADFQRYQLAAAYLTLTGNAVSQAVTIASLRAQLQATQEVIAIDEQTLALVRQEFTAGKVARTDVLTAQTQLAADRTALPTLRQQLSVARHALSVLTGRAPITWSPPSFALTDFALPEQLPLSLPSTLVRQRPDILAAEATLHADSAAIGIATAQLFPNFTLSANMGQQATTIGTLFDAANRFWGLSANIAAPLFRGGTLRAQRRAAIDTYKASLASYEQTVLRGFQQVADTLQALSHDAELVDSQRQVLDNSRESLALQRLSYAAGKTSILDLINAQRAYQQARLGFEQAQAQRLQDSAQLFVALGGGWWQNEL